MTDRYPFLPAVIILLVGVYLATLEYTVPAARQAQARALLRELRQPATAIQVEPHD